MRTIQLAARRTLEERREPQPPDPGPGEALVRLAGASRIFIVVTHKLPLEAAPAAFGMLAGYSDGVGKALTEI